MCWGYIRVIEEASEGIFISIKIMFSYFKGEYL